MRPIVLLLLAVVAACGGAPPAVCEREFVTGAGVTFLDCADRTRAVLTHGEDAHCVPGHDGLRERRQLSCDDGLELSLEAGPDGSCAIVAGDAAALPKAHATCIAFEP